MASAKELILEYLANRIDEGDIIANLGKKEMQFSREGNVATNYDFSDNTDRLASSIKNILNKYLHEASIDYEAHHQPPQDHIYIDLLRLYSLVIDDKNYLITNNKN